MSKKRYAVLRPTEDGLFSVVDIKELLENPVENYGIEEFWGDEAFDEMDYSDWERDWNGGAFLIEYRIVQPKAVKTVEKWELE